MTKETQPHDAPLSELERSEHELPEFLLLAKARQRAFIEKTKAAASHVKDIIEKAAPYPTDA